ncbi:MAG TPA: rhomboid family intramembrane serine protease [Polyangiaceae bacterium]
MLPVRDYLPARRFPFVNYAIIAVNVAAFVLEEIGGGPDAWSNAFGLIPAQMTSDPVGGAPYLFTHMFLHGSLMHIGGNMLFLWIFGDNVEDALGHLRYAAFYLLSGLAAASAQVLAGPHSQVPMVGASGAIAGVLGAYLLLYPRSPIAVINPIPLFWLFWGLFIYLPAWFVLLEFFVVNLWSAMHPVRGEAGGVAFMAHVGGFVAGLILMPLLRSESAVDHDRWDRLARRRGG